MSDISEKIQTRGFWAVRVHPLDFQKNRISKHSVLIGAVKKCTVDFREWDFPHFDHKAPTIRTPDYVEQEIDWQHHIELWRAYKNGQFVSISALWDDWRNQSDLWPATTEWAPGDELSVEGIVFRMVEIFEFAARWARVANVGNEIVVECKLQGLEGRALRIGPGRAGFIDRRAASINEWEWKNQYPLAVLFSTPRKLAIDPVINLFELFGWDTNENIIRDIQKELRA